MKKTPHTSNTCPECGTAIPQSAPDGLCPKCLLSRALEVDTDLGDVPTLGMSDIDLASVDVDTLATVVEMPGRYAHLDVYGKGGMGRVLLVHDEHLGRDVALKELLPDLGDGSTPGPARHSKAMVARFLREAKITGQLEHPSITPVHELGRRADGTLYYTMKLVRGRTLSKAIEAAAGLDERLRLLPHFVDLCNALAYAHSRGVLHRDIKPSNVMLGNYGETVIVDWGLAKRKAADDLRDFDDADTEGASTDGGYQEANATHHGSALGTPAYMAPEQALGDAENIDERSDIYSLGAVLFEILTGSAPVGGGDRAEVIRRAIAGERRTISALEPTCPKALVDMVDKAMALNPEARFQSAQALGAAVEGWKPLVVPTRLRRYLRNGAVALGLIVVLGTCWLDRHYRILVNREHEQIREEGGVLSPFDIGSPREAEAQPSTQNGLGFSVQGFLLSMEKIYPGLEEAAGAAAELNDLARSPAAITAEQHAAIELALATPGELLERSIEAVSHPPSTGADLVRAREFLIQAPVSVRYPSYVACKDIADLIKLRAALRWKGGDYDGAMDDLEALLSFGLHLKDGPSLIDLMVGSAVAARSVEDVNVWLAEGLPSAERLGRYAARLVDVTARGAAVNALNGERYNGLWMYRTLDQGDLSPLRNLMEQSNTTWQYRLISSLPLRWLRRWQELWYLQSMGIAVHAHALPYYKGLPLFEAGEKHLNSPGPLQVPAILPNLWRSYIEVSVVETRMDVARVALAATRYRLDTGTYPEGLAALVPRYLESIPLDGFDAQPLRYRNEGDHVVIYGIGNDEVDDGGALDDKERLDIGWNVDWYSPPSGTTSD